MQKFKGNPFLMAAFLLELSFAGIQSQTELDETVDNCFDAYKHLRAKEHLAGGLNRDDKQALTLLESLCVAGAKESNKRTGTFRWRTDLPALHECYARECDTNCPMTEEMLEAVAGQATTTQPQSATQPPVVVDSEGTPAAGQPAEAGADGEQKKKRKGRLEDQVVYEIRQLLAKKAGEEGYMKQGDIAKKYSIDASTVSDIKVGRGRYGKDQAVTGVSTGAVVPDAQSPSQGAPVVDEGGAAAEQIAQTGGEPATEAFE